MKICVCVRTRDEELRIAQYCEAWKDADYILVADGGSIDKTKEIASKYPNVIIRDFTERTELWNGHWRNNDSAHANFLFDWAKEYNPDWIIYEDADVRPNHLMREGYRYVMENTDTNIDIIMAVHFYLWGTTQFFPWMSSPDHEHFEACLFAWRGHVDLKTIDNPPAYFFKVGDRRIYDFRKDMSVYELMPPFAMMHFSWDDPIRTAEKIRMYRVSGFIPGMLHPLEFAGPLQDLPDYLHE